MSELKDTKDTKDRILDAAELLFSEQGVAATSLRSITQRAGVNTAAIHYHFGDKPALLEAIVSRRIAPMNQERLKRLEQLEAAAGDGPVVVERLLEAYLGPVVAAGTEWGESARKLGALMARLRLEQADIEPLFANFQDLHTRYAGALSATLPQLDREEAGERLDYAVGAMIHLLMHSRATSTTLPADSGAGIESRFARMIHFLAAGFPRTLGRHSGPPLLKDQAREVVRSPGGAHMSSGPATVKQPSPDTPARPVPVERFGARSRRRIAPHHLRWLLPLLAIGVGVLLSALMFQTTPRPEMVDPVVASPLVRVATVRPETLRMQVVAHGTVASRTESDLIAEVRGRILSVAPSLVAGGFFSRGDELLRLDDREHRIAVARARAQVELRSSEARLAAADAARRRQLAERGAASAADLELFESRELVAKASLDEVRAALQQAELDLERTTLRAPFDGRVRDRTVDLGQFVNPGTKLARISAVDYAEVRLPVQTEDLVFLDLGFGVSEVADSIAGSPIMLRARLGGRNLEWPATLVRSEGEIDLQTRTLHLVARVDDPYGRTTPGVSPLPSGLFVEAEIAGRELEGVFVLPTAAVRDGDTVFVVDADDRLEVRAVEVIRRDRERVVVGEGLRAEERIVVSPLRAVSEGMQLRTVEAGTP